MSVSKTIDSGIGRISYLEEIAPFLKSEEILVLIWARRSGKTTLIYQLVNQLLKTNPKEEIVFFTSQ